MSVTLACMPRNPAALTALVAQLNVTNDERYLPAKGLTWCNRYVADFTSALGCPVPFRLANAQVLWLDSIEAGMDQWERVSYVEALAAVEKGEVVVVGWFNPDGHGHVAVGVPAPGVELHISQAGSRNFASKPVSSGFGSHAVKIWRHR